MGYNRSGARRTARLKRHKREMERLAAKVQKAEGGQKEGSAVKTVGEKATGHKH